MEKVEGIVLAKTPLGEADELIACFTKEHGKMYFRARGVRKGKAKHSGALQELNMLDIYFVQSKSGPLITDTTLHEPYSKLKSSPEKINAAQNVVKVVLTFPSEFPDMVLWWQLVDYLSVLETTDKGAFSLAPSYFLLSMLKLHGAQPEFDKCVLCGVEVSGGSQCFFSVRSGGIVGEECAQKEEDLISIVGPERATLMTWKSLTLRDTLQQEFLPETERDVSELIERYCAWHLGEHTSVR